MVNRMVFRFNKDIYPLAVLLKAAYTFTERAYVHLDEKDGYYTADLEPKAGCGKINEKAHTIDKSIPSCDIILFIIVNK